MQRTLILILFLVTLTLMRTWNPKRALWKWYWCKWNNRAWWRCFREHSWGMYFDWIANYPRNIIYRRRSTKVHINQKNKASVKKTKKKLQDQGTVLFVFIVRNNIPNKSHIRCMFQCAARKEKSKLKKVDMFIVCHCGWFLWLYIRLAEVTRSPPAIEAMF